MSRDNWRCQVEACRSTTKTLNVHHIKYFSVFPWECPDRFLITLCKDCHSLITDYGQHCSTPELVRKFTATRKKDETEMTQTKLNLPDSPGVNAPPTVAAAIAMMETGLAALRGALLQPSPTPDVEAPVLKVAPRAKPDEFTHRDMLLQLKKDGKQHYGEVATIVMGVWRYGQGCFYSKASRYPTHDHAMEYYKAWQATLHRAAKRLKGFKDNCVASSIPVLGLIYMLSTEKYGSSALADQFLDLMHNTPGVTTTRPSMFAKLEEKLRTKSYNGRERDALCASAWNAWRNQKPWIEQWTQTDEPAMKAGGDRLLEICLPPAG